MRRLLIASFACLALTATAAQAETVSRVHGGDTFIAGEVISEPLAAPGDVFSAGSVVTMSGTTSGDIHVAGFDLDIATQTGGDLYAAGSTVTIDADIGQNATVAGFSLRATSDATITGNLRFFGRTLTIDSAVTGALTAFGDTVTLNAPVQGDAWIVAEKVDFGPDARIGGRLILSVPDGSIVPARVIPGDRITLEDWDRGRMYDEFDRSWDQVDLPSLPSWMSLFSAFLISAIFLILIAAIFLAFAPRQVEKMRKHVTSRPLNTFLLGIIGLATLFGLVPITALTIVGLPFVPFALLLIVVAWTLGYLLAAYAIALRILVAFDAPQEPTTFVRLLAVGLAIVAVAFLNFIPFIGWIVNYTLVLLGVGAMTWALLARLIPDPDPALEIDMRTTIKD